MPVPWVARATRVYRRPIIDRSVSRSSSSYQWCPNSLRVSRLLEELEVFLVWISLLDRSESLVDVELKCLEK